MGLSCPDSQVLLYEVFKYLQKPISFCFLICLLINKAYPVKKVTCKNISMYKTIESTVFSNT
jgi:hypothetical protein